MSQEIHLDASHNFMPVYMAKLLGLKPQGMFKAVSLLAKEIVGTISGVPLLEWVSDDQR